MRAIRNITWFLLAFLLTVWAGVASAQDRWYNATVSGSPSARWPGQLEACQKALAVAHSKGNALDWTITGYNSTTVTCVGKRGTSATTWTQGNYTSGLCPTSTPYLSGGFCVATKPDPDPEPEPEPPIECKADGEVFTGNWKVGTNSPASVTYNPMKDPGASDGSCCVRVTKVKRCYTLPNSGDANAAWCTFEYVRDGNICKIDSDSPPPDLNPPPTDADRKDVPPLDSPTGPCPAGTVNVGTNSDGGPRCAGTGSDPKNAPPAPPKVESEKTVSSDDGTQTTTKTEVTTNADGSKTTVTTVTITKPDGSKQTDQQKDVSNTPTGSPGKDDSKKDEEKYDLCKQNPNLTICKNSSVAGKCGEISCTGDAIQCATLRAAAAMQCKQQADHDELVASDVFKSGSAVLAGNDPMSDKLPTPGNGTVVDIPTLNADGWLGAGSAFENVSFTVQGRSVVIPLAEYTKHLVIFRYALMVVASLVSFRILSGAILRE